MSEGDSDSRRVASVRLWQTLQAVAPNAREDALDQLRERIGWAEEGVAAIDRPMTLKMARGFSGKGTSLGGHRRTHAPLPTLPVPARRNEIAGGRADIARITGEAPQGFAYPHGSLYRETGKLVREAGYEWAVTSRCDIIHPRYHDRYRLPRLPWVTGRPIDWRRRLPASEVSG